MSDGSLPLDEESEDDERGERRRKIVAERREQLVACAEAVAKLAKHRDIKPILAGHVRHDREIRRVLDTVVRRWTLLVPTRFISTGAARSGAKRHREHVVPARVLVDRMIMNPDECRVLFDTAVIIASVTPVEHRKLGGIYTHHEELYRRMLPADVSRLPGLGNQRYLDSGVKIRPIIGSDPIGSRSRTLRGVAARQTC